MSNTSIIAEKEASAAATCPLCCEAKIDILLSKCLHESCAACMVKWVKKAEASGHLEHPTCPFCRTEISQHEASTLLGRPFEPAQATFDNNSSLLDEVEADDLTLDWLREQTRPCPHCGALIEKEEGCDLMECLCGYRFCYGCGSPGAQCSCTPESHVFYDNVIHRNVDRAAQAQEEAPMNDETGLVDLQAHIERRLERENIQRERENRRYREEWERMEGDEMMMSAKWLFCAPSREQSLWVLQQQAQMYAVQQDREENRESLQYEQSTIHPVLSSGTFLFRVNHSGIERVLHQLGNGYNVQHLRIQNHIRQRREIRNVEEGIDAVLAHGRWLFQKQGRAKTLKLLARLMETQLDSQKRGRL